MAKLGVSRVVVEIPTIGTMTADLIKGKSIVTPRIENPEYIMTVGNARPIVGLANMVDILYTIVAKFPKMYLPKRREIT